MKKPKTYAYLQDWGTYSNQTLVIVGMTHAQLLTYMARKKYRKSLVYSFRDSIKSMVEKDGTYGAKGFCAFVEGASIMWLPSWRNDMSNLATLVHETSHLVQHIICRDKLMADEDEAIAYQHEFLFGAIAKRLTELVEGNKSK